MKYILQRFQMFHMWPLIYIFCFMGIFGVHSSLFALTKEEIRTEADQIMMQFEKGEISEASAMNQLDLIEEKAQNLKKTPTTIPETTSTPSKAEEIASTSLLRKATLPELSLWEWFWPIFRPFLIVILLFTTCGFIVGYIGIEKVEIWSRKLNQVYQNKRNEFFSAFRTTPQNVAPPPRARQNFSPPNPEARHSGEVPDYLT